MGGSRFSVPVPLRVFVSNLRVAGKLRLGLFWTKRKGGPYLKALRVSFVDMPEHSVSIKPMTSSMIDIRDLPGLDRTVENALNMPSVTAEEAKVMGPWIKLADHLGGFAGQLTEEPIEAINILYDGHVAEMNTAALTSAAIAGIMKSSNPDANMVSAPVVAKERGIDISTTTQTKSGVFDGYVKLTIVTPTRERSIAGTVFSDGKPRFIQIKGINIDAEVGAHMLYTTNEDVPGIIGTLGQTMGDNGVNIANFTLGRSERSGEAIALLYLDEQPPASVLEKLIATGMFQQVRPLQFEVN